MIATTRFRRRGLTLLELLMVVTVMGILAVVGTARFGRSVQANFGSQAEARALSLAMLRARRIAITTGDNHYIQFNAASPSLATQYNLMRRTGSGNVLVEGPHLFDVNVKVVASAAEMDFSFEGQAAAAYQVDFTGDGRKWRINTVPITGAVAVAEVAP